MIGMFYGRIEELDFHRKYEAKVGSLLFYIGIAK